MNDFVEEDDKDIKGWDDEEEFGHPPTSGEKAALLASFETAQEEATRDRSRR
jgi:hypothetical protein